MAKSPKLSLPKSWSTHVKSAMLHVISMAQYATAYTRGWAADSANARVRLKARVEQLEQELACLREEVRIKDARMSSITPHKRPHYTPTERLAILELRAARCWKLQQTADAFLVTPATVASWMKRVDEQGPEALLRIREPVNKFPEFVSYAVRRLRTLCPQMGKVNLARWPSEEPLFPDVFAACSFPLGSRANHCGDPGLDRIGKLGPSLDDKLKIRIEFSVFMNNGTAFGIALFQSVVFPWRIRAGSTPASAIDLRRFGQASIQLRQMNRAKPLQMLEQFLGTKGESSHGSFYV